MYITVFVDDSMGSAKIKAELDYERDQILKVFTGKIVPPTRIEMLGGHRVEVRDVLGCSLRYCRELRWCKFSMEDAIAKALKRFGMQGCRTAATPINRQAPVDD